MNARLVSILVTLLALVFPATVPATSYQWPQGWIVSGGGRDAYEVVADNDVRHGAGASMLLRPKGEPAGYGTLMQVIDARDYAGKRVRLRAFIRTQAATRRVDFWARVQGVGSPGDGAGIGGGGNTALPEASEWEAFEMVFEVPAGATQVQFGVGLDGPGRIWLADVTLEKVPKSVPLAGSWPMAGRTRAGGAP